MRRWLDGLAVDAQARAELIRRTLTGALRSLPGRAGAVERAAAEQLAAAADLRAQVDLAYASARQEVEDALRSGSLLRGEVVARWHEVVGTGELMRELQTRLACIRDKLASLRHRAATCPPTSSERLSSTGSRRSSGRLPSAPQSARRTPGARTRPGGRSSTRRRG